MPHYNLAALLDNAATAHPERLAIVSGQDRLTYSDVHIRANRFANDLVARGIRPGDKVALALPNLPDFTVAYFGILKTGATVVPLNILLKRREIAYHLSDSDAKAFICYAGSEELPISEEGLAAFEQSPRCRHFILAESDEYDRPRPPDLETMENVVTGSDGAFNTVETDEDDVAVLLYTSGTTGEPKGAELRHRNLRDNARCAGTMLGAATHTPDRYLAVLPLFHAFGQTVIQNCAFAHGGTVVMQRRFDANDALGLIRDERVTVFAGVPTMYWSLLNVLRADPEAVAGVTASIRCTLSGGSALPAQIRQEIRSYFGVRVLEGYGLSETSPVAAHNRYDEPDGPVGSVGRPIPGVQMRLIERDGWDEIPWSPRTASSAIGEIAIRGHNVMKGYYKRPDATSAAIGPDGWFRTGDLGCRDESGHYYVVDRAKDLIIRGGYNVYPREIEETLLSHPDISYAAVVGIPDDVYGEEIKAYVMLDPGAIVFPEEIISWAKKRMANYKYPREVVVRKGLPMTATGKIVKRDLV